MNITKLIATIITLPQAVRNEVNLIKIKQEMEHKQALINLGIEPVIDWNKDLEI